MPYYNLPRIAEVIQAEVGSERAEITVIQYGIQAHIIDQPFRINFYYGKRGFKYFRTDSPASPVKFTLGQEGSIILNLITIIKAKTETKKREAKVIELSNTGIEAFINHIKNKLETYKRVHKVPNGEETQAMVLLSTIISEADQFKQL